MPYLLVTTHIRLEAGPCIGGYAVLTWNSLTEVLFEGLKKTDICYTEGGVSLAVMFYSNMEKVP